MLKNLLFSLLLIGFSQISLGQVSAKVVDAKTGEVLPYANISIDRSQNQVSNEEGFFSIPESKPDGTTIGVSFFGYMSRELTLAQLKSAGMVVTMSPAAIELQEVQALKPDPVKIMASVKANLKKNHGSMDKMRKDKIFFRTSSAFIPKDIGIEITKSTGFSKNALKEANVEISSFISRMNTKPPREYADLLVDYYSGPVVKDGKKTYLAKMDVAKATKLMDETRSVSLDDLEKKATNLFLKHLDTMKYYRIKSGWIGSRDTISLRKDFQSKKKKKEKKENMQLTSAKGKLMSILTENNIISGEHMNFASEPELYTYTYQGATYLNEDDFAYVIDFKPRKSDAKYTGRLYISERDFAVLRADYKLAEGKKLSNVNLKLILGVKVQENLSRGTLIFSRNSIADGYMLRYASRESGQYIYVHRPIKFIELTDEDRDVVAFDMLLEGSMNDRIEYLNIERDELSPDAFEGIAEKDFAYQRINKYDPTLWKDHASIEPMEEIKRYKLEDGANP